MKSLHGSVSPFLKSEYFTDTNERTIYEFTYEYFQKYTKPPTVEALLINLDNSTNVNEKIITDSKSIVEGFGRDDTHSRLVIRRDREVVQR